MRSGLGRGWWLGAATNLGQGRVLRAWAGTVAGVVTGPWEETTERKNEEPSSAPLWWTFCPGAPKFVADGVEVIQGQVKSGRMPR